MSKSAREKQTVLLADEPRYAKRLKEALAQYNLIEATSVENAEQLMTDHKVDLVIVGAHFDDSRSVQLINAVRKDTRHKESPILAVRMAPSDNPKILLDTFSTMIKLRLLSAYLEINDFAKEGQEVRSVVKNLLSTQ
ncbi:MAG TPA: hypothetical protein V6C81_29320 [Planktothrix sp.]|jgi:response regulator RpfG family c-di-GMP phosphodiesterase